MQTPFVIHKYVIGNEFISRKKEVVTLSEYLQKKNNIILYDTPKSGKQSLIFHCLNILKKSGAESRVLCIIDLFNTRDIEHFCAFFLNYVANSLLARFDDLEETLTLYLPITKPVIDRSSSEIKLSFSDIKINDDTLREILDLPEKLATHYDIEILIYYKEFQNFLHLDNPDRRLKLIEKTIKEHRRTTYIITGSKVNAMKHIFEVKKYLYNFARTISLTIPDEKEMGDHIIKVFLRVGRVVQQNHINSMYHVTGGHPWYTLQLATICFNLTKGYLNDGIIRDATILLLNNYSPCFYDIVDDLSSFQLSLLRAALDGNDKFSSADTILRYGLNSSANVYRLKEALAKKEILTFDKSDKAHFINPLFKYWLKHYYFI